jgi:hypothetical protein
VFRLRAALISVYAGLMIFKIIFFSIAAMSPTQFYAPSASAC